MEGEMGCYEEAISRLYQTIDRTVPIQEVGGVGET